MELIAEVAELMGDVRALEKRRETERENTRRYRARGGDSIPGWMRQKVFERDDFRCVDCGSSERLECDHIIPVSKDGATCLENLQTLCKPCNARKRDRIRKSDERGQTRTNSDESGRLQTSVDLENDPPALDKESVPHTPFKENNLTPRTNRTREVRFVLPSDIPEEPWDGFEEMRRRIGKPMTNRARGLAVEKLRKLAECGWPPGDVLNHCTLNSYQGIFPPRDERNGRPASRSANDDGLGPTARAALAAFPDAALGRS